VKVDSFKMLIGQHNRDLFGDLQFSARCHKRADDEVEKLTRGQTNSCEATSD